MLIDLMKALLINCLQLFGNFNEFLNKSQKAPTLNRVFNNLSVSEDGGEGFFCSPLFRVSIKKCP